MKKVKEARDLVRTEQARASGAETKAEAESAKVKELTADKASRKVIPFAARLQEIRT